jgi:UDP-N-acetylmuramoyl-tripeptide--D-alanyl-D-alanine ligase
MQLTIEAILAVCKGEILYGEVTNQLITSVSTDTRKISAGALFVPIIGETFDGHDYIPKATEAGAVCTLTEKRCIFGSSENSKPDSFYGNPRSFTVIYVPSTRRALMDLAAYYRRLHNVKVVAVTGSAGKTTTKEMVAAILSQRYKTKKTMGNFNNDIGLPLSVFQLEPDDQMLVLEMGMNHANEITALSKAGAPDISVITHIGDAHIENFANREGILRAKLEITDGLHPDGTVIINGDDPLLTGEIVAEKLRGFKVLSPSSAHIIKAEPRGMSETRCHFRMQDQDIHLTVPLPGNHMVMNALLAAAVGIELGMTPQEIACGFAALEVPDGRLSIIQTNDMTIIDDAYNANPASMQEAINVLIQRNEGKRRVCILGDMNELGHVAEDRHRELGIYAANPNIDLLIAIGAMSRWIYEGYLSATDRVFSALHFLSTEAFLSQWRTILFPGDVVLVKASHSMAFEKIVEGLQCTQA